jgi:hypothetical protein
VSQRLRGRIFPAISHDLDNKKSNRVAAQACPSNPSALD